jgi:Tfp pilus assembly protein PilN
MPLINLIAQERERIRQLRGRTRAIGFVWVGVIILVAVAYGGLSLYVASMESQTRDMQAEITKLEPVLRDVELTRQKLGSLSPQISSLKSAQTDTTRWQRILAHLSANAPSNFWVTGVRTAERSNPKAPITVSINGVAATQELVGEFMLRLNQCIDLDKVELRFTQERMLNAFMSGVDFEVGAALKGTEPPQKKEEAANGEAQKS